METQATKAAKIKKKIKVTKIGRAVCSFERMSEVRKVYFVEISYGDYSFDFQMLSKEKNARELLSYLKGESVANIINGHIDFSNSLDDDDRYFQWGTIEYIVKFKKEEN